MSSHYYFNKQSMLLMSLITVNFHFFFVFCHYFFRAFHFCLLDTKILALEGIRSVMYRAQDTTLKITIKTIYLKWSEKYSGSRHLWWLTDVRFPQLTKIKVEHCTHFQHCSGLHSDQFFHHIFSVIYPRIVFIHHKTRMLSLIWVLNSTPVTAIQLFFLN